MKRGVTVAALLFVAFMLVAPSLSGQERITPVPAPAAELNAPLHDRAVRAGGNLIERLLDEGPMACASLAELGARSPVVTIGEVLGHRQHLMSDGSRTVTDTVVRVQETVKGGIARGALITVSVPGGSYRFSDGATVHQTQVGYQPLREGARVLLFLRESADRRVVRGEIAYEFALGRQGQFELDFARDVVIPAVGNPAHTLAIRYHDMKIRPFLAELHRGVGTER